MNKSRKRMTVATRTIVLGLLTALPLTATSQSQRLLTLDSCRAMALSYNKQMSAAKMKQDVMENQRKSARTKYLPHVSAMGGYVWMSKEVSLLDDDQKTNLGSLGTNATSGIQADLGAMMSTLPAALQTQIGKSLGQFAGLLDGAGQGIVDALRTDTRNMFAGAVVVTQPVFMGGAIVAQNKIADIGEDMAANSLEATRQNTLFNIDQVYWQVVSLRHKEKLATNFLELVKKLDDDVQKMIAEGVATKSDGLSVSVKVNEAEMALTKVSDGLTLSRMLLCQLIGLPLDENIRLADEEDMLDNVAANARRTESNLAPNTADVSRRPELKLLQNTVEITQQTTNLLKAANLPQVLLTGGYVMTNPNTFNGFEKKFGGFWNVGVLVRVPVWNWGDVKYKVRASKGATAIANLNLSDAREKIELQVNQSNFKVNEAYKKLTMAQSSIARAEENLRTANLGFKEGVISSTTVMEAQTAWLQAQSQKIDAEIDVKLSQVELQKALGTLTQ